MRLVWSPHARTRIRSICNYIARKFYPDYARRLRSDVVDTALLASDNPNLGELAFPHLDCPDIRRLLCRNRRHWVYYRVAGDTCEILSVRHGLQNTLTPRDL